MPSTSRAASLRRIFETTAPAAALWIRVAVGLVFVSEGIQKFLYPAALGAGRFGKIGIPAAQVMGPFIGFLETACGALVLAGLLTRVAALLLLADMTVAILSTKVPILIGHGYWRFAAPSGGKTGLWAMIHTARTDLSMWLSCLFLLLAGAGAGSADARVAARLSGARKVVPR